jgi:hypothetical protein
MPNAADAHEDDMRILVVGAVREMHETGELETLLASAVGAEMRSLEKPTSIIASLLDRR